MRVLIPDVITKEEADWLIQGGSIRSHRFNNDIVKKVVARIQETLPVVVGKPSYWSVERKPDGHIPHYDGCRPDPEGGFKPNHMPWCQYSSVVLLSDPSSFDGGVFSFFDPDEDHKEDLYLSLLLYSSGAGNSPQKHQASAHKDGDRHVLLMFFATEASREL